MASVYILFSENKNCFYIGSCEELPARLEQHISNHFEGSFTSRANDWKIFLSINDLSYKQARFIETQIKKMKSKVYINNLKKYPEMISNLIEKYKLVE